jgi:pilus assembly protein CpaC
VTSITNGVASTTQTITTGLPTVTSSINTSIPCSSPNNAQGVLKALEQVGLVHMLAEPNLTAVSGETAKFLAGGEFPVPASRDRDGNVTVVFKQFGVGLSFTPVVLSPGRISIQLSSEVSELTNTGSFLLNGSTSGNGLSIPALSVRRTETTVELPSGGSFAVAGLMQHNTKQVIDGFPGVKDLPVLGALFRSRDFADEQTELVVLVSAYLVEPTAESALSAPTDGFVAPTDPETLLLGRLNATYRKRDEQPVAAQASAPVGFVVR